MAEIKDIPSTDQKKSKRKESKAKKPNKKEGKKKLIIVTLKNLNKN
ncbi:hypothetical protein [Spiroplasma endosymbiont of Polydrusus pterygomalis]